jgi:hypothetical protein
MPSAQLSTTVNGDSASRRVSPGSMKENPLAVWSHIVGVICAFLPHFNLQMYGWVIVRD